MSTTPWLQATLADLIDVDFEVPIAGFSTADTWDLSEVYRSAAQSLEAEGQTLETSAHLRLFAFLSAVTSMYLKSGDRAEPFGPRFAFSDGNRTAISDDFRGHIDLLAELAIRATNPVLRARLADVCWLLDRKRGSLGSAAVAAYIDTVECVESGAFARPFAGDSDGLDFRVCELLRRALYIGLGIGRDKPEVVNACEALARLRLKTAERGIPAAVMWFSELDLEFGASLPESVAADIEKMLVAEPATNVHLLASLWRLAARGYRKAGRNDDRHRCQASAAEAMVTEADRILAEQGAAMLATHMIGNAIAQLHGVPNAKERRTALRHRLIDIQARIPDEMTTFSHQWDTAETEAQVKEAIGEKPLIEQLFIFSALARSPDPAELVAEARTTVSQFPLSALIPTAHTDKDGKTIHRSGSGGQSDDPTDPAIIRVIAQSESIRRNAVGSAIEAARRIMMAQGSVPENLLVVLLHHSPFVPPELLGTFSRGFLRFFQGDFASAIYILTPLLENSLRHVLKMNGHDVTTFDDTDQTQQDRTISSLFEQMREELDAIFSRAVTTDIENVFLNHPGPRLRHTIAHGLAHDGTPYGADAIYAGWLIFRLCLVPLYPYKERLLETVQQSRGPS